MFRKLTVLFGVLSLIACQGSEEPSPANNVHINPKNEVLKGYAEHEDVNRIVVEVFNQRDQQWQVNEEIPVFSSTPGQLADQSLYVFIHPRFNLAKFGPPTFQDFLCYWDANCSPVESTNVTGKFRLVQKCRAGAASECPNNQPLPILATNGQECWLETAMVESQNPDGSISRSFNSEVSYQELLDECYQSSRELTMQWIVEPLVVSRSRTYELGDNMSFALEYLSVDNRQIVSGELFNITSVKQLTPTPAANVPIETLFDECLTSAGSYRKTIDVTDMALGSVICVDSPQVGISGVMKITSRGGTNATQLHISEAEY